METEGVIKPVIQKGCFKAPQIRPEWRMAPQYAVMLDPKVRSDQSPFINNSAEIPLHKDVIFETNNAATTFWEEQVLPEGFLLEQTDQMMPMDTREEEEEGYGGGDENETSMIGTTDTGMGMMTMESEDEEDPKPQAETSTKKKFRNVVEVFHDEFVKLGPQSMLGQTTAEGKIFRLVFPGGMAGEYLKLKIPNMTLMIHSGERDLQPDAEQLVVASQMLCSPVHVSPLFLALNRDFQPCHRITDAITSMMRLSIVRLVLMKTDTSDPAHKARANKYRETLFKHASSKYFGVVDEIVEKGSVPVEKREIKDARQYFQWLINRFGMATENFALAMIHVVEWNIMDILHIPFVMRSGLMTPNILDQRVDPRTHMSGTSFEILRSNLCNYLRNRNDLFCMKYVVDTDTGRFKSTKVIDPDAWQPMHLDEPRLEDRLKLLETYRRNPGPNGEPATEAVVKHSDRVMFGLYNNWISMHTLREFMLFLSEDTRPKPRRLEARPRQKLNEELERDNQQQQEEEEVDDGDDEGK